MTPEGQTRLTLGRAGVRNLIWAVGLFSIFTNLLMLTGPLFMLQVYDRVLAARSEETLVALFVLVAGLYLFYWFLEFARGRVMSRVGGKLQARFNGAVFSAVMERAALRSPEKRGALIDLDAVRTFLTSPVFLALMDMPWTPLFIVAIFIFHPLLGWVALAGGVILIGGAILNQVLTARKVRESTQMLSASQKFSREAEAAGEFLWAQGMRAPMTQRWSAMQDEAVRKNMQATDWTSAFTSFSKAFRLFLQSAILAVGAWLVLQNELSAGAMIAASILMGRALAPVELAVSQWSMFQRARAGWRDLKALLAAIPARTTPTELPPPAARLELSNITVVARRGDPPILHQINMAIEPGEAIGIIGRSGSGKTTLARVIVGLVTPLTGSVRLDGAALDQYGPDRLGKYIGYLPQEVRLIDGTVAENIAQMDVQPDAARVVDAARKAQAHDIILKLPKGYDTRISMGDALLSGGQRQRLALARALYNDPVLLVLDEPNSALDAEGSEALNATVNAMKEAGKAVLIMTHRPTAISTCDKLLVLDGGRIAGFGPRDEIVKSMMKNAADIQRAVAEGGR